MKILVSVNLGRTKYEVRDDGTPGILTIVRIQGDGTTTSLPVARGLLEEYAAHAAGRALTTLLQSKR